MQDKCIAEIRNEIETQFLKEVLTDRGIPFRIESCADNYWGLYMGKGAVSGLYNQGALMPFGYVWGYEDDAAVIQQALAEIRAAAPQDVQPPRPPMYRIKRP